MSINRLYATAGAADALLVQLDDQTKTVRISEDGGATFERAPGALEAALTGGPYVDPGPHDPLDGDTIENRSVLEYIIFYYRRDLVGHRLFKSAIGPFLETAQKNVAFRQAMQNHNNYTCWDCIAESLTEYLDQNP